ncbi:uncharacterized protein ACNLHF_013943 [Anomaloglossus baeobatrachus]
MSADVLELPNPHLPQSAAIDKTLLPQNFVQFVTEDFTLLMASNGLSLQLHTPHFQLLLVTVVTLLRRRREQAKKKKMWVHPLLVARETKGHFSLLYQDLRRFPEKFTSFCRLSIPAFDRLLALVKSDLCYADTRMRKSVSAEERFLATGESYTSLHLQFRIGKSTISEIVRCTFGVIWQKLQPMVMPSPTEETWLQIAAGFQTVANFPNCIGAVDGKHVRVQKPPRSGSLFFNYKKYFFSGPHGGG